MSARTCTVLVVDDTHEVLAFLALFLGEEGYTVRTAASLTEAEQALADDLPDVVVADVRLPGHPPFALLDRLDAVPATHTIPVLLCTGAVHDLRAEPARWQPPHTAALVKPFDIDQMLGCLARLLAGKRPLAEHGAFLIDHT